MNRLLNALLAFAAGLAGAWVSYYFSPAVVHAQSGPPLKIQSQSFVIVDPNNNPVGTFTSSPSPNGPAVVLLDRNGREIWRGGSPVIRPLTQR